MSLPFYLILNLHWIEVALTKAVPRPTASAITWDFNTNVNFWTPAHTY